MANSDYTVGWISAIKNEYVAALALLDETHKVEYDQPPNDHNAYTLGRMGKHNIVIAVLPDGEYGLTGATGVAKDMLRTFPNVRIGLMVGIGGGVPSLPSDNDIRLGDIVVSSPWDGQGGVLQYDFGSTVQNQDFQITGHLNQPPMVLRTAVTKIQGIHEMDGHAINDSINEAIQKKPRLRKAYSRPDSHTDRLYEADCVHGDQACCTDDPSDDKGQQIVRGDRDVGDENGPVIHYGLIASGNQLMQDAIFRDKLAREYNILCFEMEAAGLMNQFPCLVIRGICDYSDSHKHKKWQGYAAMAAAAYARELLCQIIPSHVESQRKISELVPVVQKVHDTVIRTERVVGNISGHQKKSDDQHILNWLTEINYGVRHSDIFREHRKNTGQWLLDSEQFKYWTNHSTQTLFCPGIPGAGKTVLASVVVNHLIAKCEINRSLGLAFIYFNYQDRANQTIEATMSCLVKQLCEPLEELPEELKKLHDDHKKRHTRPSMEDLRYALQVTVARYSKVQFVFDALDECQTGHRERLLKDIFSLQNTSGANIFATSRHNPDIEEKFHACVKLEIAATEDDIRGYVHSRLDDLPNFIRRSPALQHDIITAISQVVRGMFLLARLYLDSLKGATSQKRIRQSIRSLQNVDDAYDFAYHDAMKRIQGQLDEIAEIASQVFVWITYAERPLTETELRHALSVEIDAPEFDMKNLVEVDIPSICAGLITIDEESRIVRLIHYTAQSYFQRNASTLFPHGQRQITDVCLTCLSYSTFAKSAPQWPAYDRELVQYLQLDSLRGYAAKNWGHHAIHVGDEPATNNKVMNFLTSQNLVDPSNVVWSEFSHDCASNRRIGGLHVAAFFGLDRALKTLCKGHDVDMVDILRRTPLQFAVAAGRERTVRSLIEARASLEIYDSEKNTPLLQAVQGDNRDIAHLLIESGAQVESYNIWGKAPLNHAAEFGYLDIVHLLIESGAQVESHDNSGRSPLLSAIVAGHLDIVRLLIESGAQVESHDNSGRSPLLSAIVAGHLDIVRLLIESGAQVESHDNVGESPLLSAIVAGHLDIVRLIIESGAQVESHDNIGEPPLLSAIVAGHLDIVRLLIESGAQVESFNSLACAAGRGHLDIVRLLIESGAEIESDDSDGQTALSLAAEAGQLDIARLLLESGAQIESCDERGRTPLIWAALHGHESMVEFLATHGASIEATDRQGNTSLLLAVRHGYEAVIHFLVDFGAMLEAADLNGRTSLSLAAELKHENIARFLIKEGAEVEISDSFGRTPLWYAARCDTNNSRILHLLTECGASMETPDIKGWTPLSIAAYCGRDSAVQYLVGNGASWTPVTDWV